MKRLLKSSNFWNAVIATILITISSKMGVEVSVLLMIGGLFGVRGVATGMQDYANAKTELIGGRPNDR